MSHIKNDIPIDFEIEVNENNIIKLKDIEEVVVAFLDRCHSKISEFVKKLEDI